MEEQHRLKTWIDDNSSQVRFAREVKCSEAHLSDILSFRKEPSLRLAARMSAATGGMVPIEAFVKQPIEAAVQ